MNNIPNDFKSIPSFPNYYIQNYGSTVIKLCDNGTYKRINDYNGKVTLFKNSKRYCKSIKQLYCEAWGHPTSKTGVYPKKVKALNIAILSNEWIKFDSYKEASDFTGVPVSTISKIISSDTHHTAHGWAFVEGGNE